MLGVRQDSVGFARYLAALEERHHATGRQIILVLDNGSCHVSKVSQAALAARAAWLEVIPLARYSPHLNPKEREWRLLKRDHRGHLAPAPCGRLWTRWRPAWPGLGGERCEVIDAVPQWWLDGHRKEPTGRRPGRPHGGQGPPAPQAAGKELTSRYLVAWRSCTSAATSKASRVLPVPPAPVTVKQPRTIVTVELCPQRRELRLRPMSRVNGVGNTAGTARDGLEA